MLTLLHLLAFLAGALVVAATLGSAARTVVLPRGAPDRLSRTVFLSMRQIFKLRARGATTYRERDEIMALYAPISLLTLPAAWLTCSAIGYMGMFWALGASSWSAAFSVSGSSLLTLGFTPVHTMATTILAFSEATIGLILVALLIAYLPAMYTAFSRREQAVTMLEVRAGTPPSAVEMFERFQRIRQLDQLATWWAAWEVWFVDVEESHTSLAALAFFR